MSKKLIQKLILKDQTSAAIDLLIDLAPKYSTDSSTENILMNLSSQFYGNEKGIKLNRLSDENYTVAKSRITSYVLEMLEDDFKEIAETDIPEKYKALLEDDTSIAPAGNDGEGGNGSEAETVESNVVLFLNANPSQTALLKLKDEHSVIATELQESTLKIKSENAVSFSEFSRAIYNKKPRVVHFSGHGDLKSTEVIEAYRGIGKSAAEKSLEDKEEPGIILFDEDKRNSFFVKASVLKAVFEAAITTLNVPIEVVIFNACHSEGQAKAVSEVGGISVIGTSNAIKDSAAIAFSRDFYFGLAEQKSVEVSFKLARIQALAYGEPLDRFTLYRDGKKIDL